MINLEDMVSKKDDFVRATLKAGRASGGSKKTQYDRQNKLVAFCSWLWSAGYQLLSPESIRVRHIVEYIAERLASGLNRRTLQNDTASIRAALRGAGRTMFANCIEISNKALGISGASRKGTKRPISDEEFRTIYKAALLIDGGLAAVIGLQRWLGLRAREAVMAIQSLPDWCQALTSGVTNTVHVIHGTKGGRSRYVTLHCRVEAIAAIEFAHAVTKQRNGKLISAPDLETALGYYHRHVRTIGLRREIAPHCLRYTYACDAVEAYKREGHSEREAQALAALDLGHGSGRGRLIREIYGRLALKDKDINKK